MTLVAHTTKDVDLLARLMRAEAIGEGDLGMLMVGNVAMNRVIADCLDFIGIRTIQEMIYQTPGGFSGRNSPLFFGSSTTKERELAGRVIRGETYHPATHALWFYAPSPGETCIAFWFNQRNAGRYKNHCFYLPAPGVCPRLH
jgi:N-acetylmuramoyl-L-alanine amidase